MLEEVDLEELATAEYRRSNLPKSYHEAGIAAEVDEIRRKRKLERQQRGTGRGESEAEGSVSPAAA